MLGFRKLYAVDYYLALLEEIAKNVKAPNIKLIKNNGTDFPGIDDRSIDYLFPSARLCIGRVSYSSISR